MTTKFTLEQKDAVENLRDTIKKNFQDFVEESAKSMNKSAAIRARKKSLVITQMLKAYRSLSIKY